jgi:hypothetical protein
MDVTRQLQIDIKALVDSWVSMKNETADIGKVYWATDANTAVGGLGSSDAATVASKITKTEFLAGITLCEQIDKFFTNQALTQSDYRASCQNIIYGNDARTTKLSESVEALGDRMKLVSQDCITIYKKCIDILKNYTENEIGTMIASIATTRIIPGSDMTKAELSAGVVICEQFKKMIGNEVAAQADYASTLAVWNHL